MSYSWERATRQQLYLIAYEEECPRELKNQAKDEIERRKHQIQKHPRVNYREKAHY